MLLASLSLFEATAFISLTTPPPPSSLSWESVTFSSLKKCPSTLVTIHGKSAARPARLA